MKRIVSLNANGIRSAAKKGFFDWLKSEDPDIVCLQEIKAEAIQLSDPLFWPEGYHCHYFSAQKKGYSGVALYSKEKPLALHQGLEHELFDAEGRSLVADFKNFSVASLYFPSGSSGPVRQDVKFSFLEYYFKSLQDILKQKKTMILCGDWNIAHKIIDLKNWRSNQKTSGFLPEERAWLDQVFDSLGFIDAFRMVDHNPDQYTWWSQRSKTAFENNVGWRIDYQVVTPDLEKKILRASIYKAKRFSDHAPLVLDYDL